MDVAQSVVLVVAILGIIVLVATISAVIILKMIVKQGKSLVQVIWGEHKRTKAENLDIKSLIK